MRFYPPDTLQPVSSRQTFFYNLPANHSQPAFHWCQPATCCCQTADPTSICPSLQSATQVLRSLTSGLRSGGACIGYIQLCSYVHTRESWNYSTYIFSPNFVWWSISYRWTPVESNICRRALKRSSFSLKSGHSESSYTLTLSERTGSCNS